MLTMMLEVLHQLLLNIPVAVLTDKTTFNFTTMGLPVLVSSSPADDEVDVDLTTTSIKLTFSEAVRKGTGNIRLMNAEDDSEIESLMCQVRK